MDAVRQKINVSDRNSTFPIDNHKRDFGMLYVCAAHIQLLSISIKMETNRFMNAVRQKISVSDRNSMFPIENHKHDFGMIYRYACVANIWHTGPDKNINQQFYGCCPIENQCFRQKFDVSYRKSQTSFWVTRRRYPVIEYTQVSLNNSFMDLVRQKINVSDRNSIFPIENIITTLG